tara:strand:- start:514 stop:669 length:156 start_codon:yes stop_codon:yes gene_type:complete
MPTNVRGYMHEPMILITDRACPDYDHLRIPFTADQRNIFASSRFRTADETR